MAIAIDGKEKLIELLTNFKDNEKYYTNKDLINYLSSAFSQKKLSRRIPNQIFMGDLEINRLNDIELICLTDNLYKYSKISTNKEFEIFNPNIFFNNIELTDYDKYNPVDIEQTQLLFKNTIQISDTQWICPFWSLYDIYNAEKYKLIRYNFETQRESKLRIIGTKGTVCREININNKSVKDIESAMYNDNFTPNLITLNILNLEGKELQVSYDDENNLIVTPQDDRDSKNTTFVDVIDGWHRISGACKAVRRAIDEGRTLSGGLIVSINIMTIEQAREHIEREAKQNNMSISYLSSLKTTDEDKFIKSLMNYSGTGMENIFKDNVTNTFEECKVYKKLTYKKVLADAVKLTTIDTKTITSFAKVIPRLVVFFNELIDYMVKDKYNTIDNLRNNTNLLDTNIWIGYFAIADKYRDLDDFNMAINIEFIANKLYELQNSGQLSSMGLKNKNYNAKEIFNYFNDLKF